MIYVVEDDTGIRDMMIYTLKSTGFDAEGCQESGVFWEKMKQRLPELVILDIMLPGEDGISILKKIRTSQLTQTIPVIMATAKGTEFDKIIGLDLGADDYLTKPFGMMEMVSRVRAVLRRSTPVVQSRELSIGKLSMNLTEHTVIADGERVVLTLKEYEMLQLFMENPGMAFTRDMLLESVWDNEYFGETRTVDVHIRTLRTKLGECGNYIQTIRGVGYRMEYDEVMDGNHEGRQV